MPAHFMDKKKESLGEFAIKSFDVVEAINGTSSAKASKEAVTRCTSSNTKFMSNSGATNVNELGQFYNTVDVESNEWQDILKSVKKGKFEPRLKFPNFFEGIKSRFFKSQF